MSVHTNISYALAALAFAAGVAAGMATGDWSWFSRSGSAVVAIGIVLTSRQVFEHNRRLQAHQRRASNGQRNGGAAGLHPHDWAGENSMRQLIRSRSREEERWRTEFTGFYMLVIGTLVWGFGDLIGLVLQ